MMTFQLTNDQGEVVLAARSDCTWETGGQAVYTTGDMNLLTWNFTPESKARWPLILTRAPGQVLYHAFTNTAHHYGLKYSGSPSEGIRDVVRLPGEIDPNWRPWRPVYTGEVFPPDELGRNAMRQPSKGRVLILETRDGREILRATLGVGRWFESVEVAYEGDTSVIRWSGSAAEPRWVYSFFKDAAQFEGLRLAGPDKDGETYMLGLPPGWTMKPVGE